MWVGSTGKTALTRIFNGKDYYIIFCFPSFCCDFGKLELIYVTCYCRY